MADQQKNEKLPPYSGESESAVLGCCLQDGDLVGDVAEQLPDENAFYDLKHRIVWTHLTKLYGAKTKPDEIVLRQSLRDSKLLEEIGGETFILGLVNSAATSTNWQYYTEIVRDKWLLRRMLTACTESATELMDGSGDVQNLLARAEQRVTQAAETRLASTEKTMGQVINDVHDNVLEKFRRGCKMLIGPPTGFNYLDNILPGLGRSQLIVLAARPRTGKSAMMMQIAENIAIASKMPVAVFSLEMSARALGSRAIFQKAGADYTKFVNGFLVEADVQKLVGSGLQLRELPIFIDESPRMAIEDMEVRARRMKRKHGVGAFFIDYFQLMYCRNSKRQWSKADELAEVSMRLKGLAKELDAPIFLCAQMNRQIELDTQRRPRLSDLRDTGQLEQDADVVMFLWKPKVPEDEGKIRNILSRVPCPAEWKTIERNGEDKTWRHYLTLVNCTVEKQREGRSGEDALMVFIKPWTRFVDAYRPPKPADAEPREETPNETQTELEEP